MSDTPATSRPSSRRPSEVRVRFIIYMVISFASTLGYTAFFHELLRLSEEVSYSIALVLSSTQNFFILTHWVYQTGDGPLVRQFFKYVLSIVGFRITEYLTFLLLHTVLGLRYDLAILIVQGSSAVTKYVVYKAIVFRTRHTATEEELALDDVGPDVVEEIVE